MNLCHIGEQAMTAMELRQQVLQDVVSLMDDDIAMMKLQSFLLSLKIAEGKVIAWNVLEEEIKHDVTI